MARTMVLGIDANLSAATRFALQTVSDLLLPVSASFQVVLLHVIPVPYSAAPGRGCYQLPPTLQQREQATRVLWQARSLLHELGVEPACIQVCQRAGSPAEELAQMARELPAQCLVVGSRGASLTHRLRRMVAGSTSREVLRHAPCPVLLAVMPPALSQKALLTWYREALLRAIHTDAGRLLSVTAEEVASRFSPLSCTTPGPLEKAAATQVLEDLVQSGILCRLEIEGTWWYYND